MTKPRAGRQVSGAVYRPVAAGWQKWQQAEDGAWALAAEAADLGELRPAPGGLVAVPVRRAFSLAVWVPAQDPALFADLVYTQLDLRGLTGSSRESTSYVWRHITTEDGEALLHAVVLPAHLAPKYWHGEVTSYAVSPAFLPLGADAVSIWNEEGGWVAAVTRGDEMIHFQPLTDPEPTAQMALEVWLMLAPLEAGRMLGEATSVRILHQGVQPPDLDDWRSIGRLPVESVPLPPPVRPPESLLCMPLPVRDVQQSKQAGARRQKIALAAAAAYFLLVLALAGGTLLLAWRAESLRKLLARDADTVEAVKQTKSRWEAMSAALDPAAYPLEVLYQVSRLLPKDGVRLTLFSMNLDRLLVTGEASTLQAAQKFQEDVRDAPELAAYDWKMDNPRPLPTGSAKFQIDGVRRTPAHDATENQNESPDI